MRSLDLRPFDYIFLATYFILWLYLFTSLTYMTVGGLILILGAWFVFKGKIFIATLNYLVADTMWLINAYEHGDTQGAFFILVGMLLGLGATYKMQFGKMAKSLKIKKNV